MHGQKNIKIIIYLLYFTLFIVELHMLPHLPRFYHNNTLLHCILSFNNFS